MRPEEWEHTYTEFVIARQTHLRRLAYAICGDWSTADAMLQAALVRLYVVWPAARRNGTEEADARRLVVRAELAREGTDEVAGRPPVVEVLQSLPPEERRAVLLRHWLGLSDEETAEDLGVSVTSARVLAGRGQAALQRLVVQEQP